jgi:hypothetical protein
MSGSLTAAVETRSFEWPSDARLLGAKFMRNSVLAVRRGPESEGTDNICSNSYPQLSNLIAEMRAQDVII